MSLDNTKLAGLAQARPKQLSLTAEKLAELSAIFHATTPGTWAGEPGVGRGAWIKNEAGQWSALALGETNTEAAANREFIVEAHKYFRELLDLASVALNVSGLA